MIGGIVEVAQAGRHVAIYRGFLTVSENSAELGRVPLDDITALILSGPQVTLSKRVIVELAERKAVIVSCGRNWLPVSLTLPLGAHFQLAGILHDQIKASGPLKKRLWQHIVRTKIDHQAAILTRHWPDHAKLTELATLSKRVKSGDPDNMEAQAARHYWRALMGETFRRDRFAKDGNVYLNYGYTVLRAATARAVCAAGLHPALGLHHGSRVNDFALADDLMEPFRPLVDSVALDLMTKDKDIELTPERKRELAKLLQLDLITDAGASPLANCLGSLARSVANSLTYKSDQLAIARIKTPDQFV